MCCSQVFIVSIVLSVRTNFSQQGWAKLSSFRLNGTVVMETERVILSFMTKSIRGTFTQMSKKRVRSFSGFFMKNIWRLLPFSISSDGKKFLSLLPCWSFVLWKCCHWSDMFLLGLSIWTTSCSVGAIRTILWCCLTWSISFWVMWVSVAVVFCLLFDENTLFHSSISLLIREGHGSKLQFLVSFVSCPFWKSTKVLRDIIRNH